MAAFGLLLAAYLGVGVALEWLALAPIEPRFPPSASEEVASYQNQIQVERSVLPAWVLSAWPGLLGLSLGWMAPLVAWVAWRKERAGQRALPSVLFALLLIRCAS